MPSGFVCWGPPPETDFQSLAGLDLSGDDSQALGDLQVLPESPVRAGKVALQIALPVRHSPLPAPLAAGAPPKLAWKDGASVLVSGS